MKAWIGLVAKWRVACADLCPVDNCLDGRLAHTVGNMMNEIIFGISYGRNDPLWRHMQNLREEGAGRLMMRNVRLL